MGLDISFNRAAAIAAGLELEVYQHGDEESIAMEASSEDPDAEYLAWLGNSSESLKVPGTDLYVVNDGIGENIIIRANKWGRIYEPMTNWLKANNITWGEF